MADATAPALSKAEQKAKRKAETLQRVLDEIKQSELGYITDLELVIQCYVKPFEKMEPPILDKQEMATMFCNIRELIDVNQALLNRLEENHSLYNVARSMESMAEQLKVYVTYCNNQDTALKLVDDLRETNKEFQEYTDNQQENLLSRGLDLRSFLIKPTQRICKYPLFLRELINNCEEGKPKEVLLKVDQTIDALVLHINEAKREKMGKDGVKNLADKLHDRSEGDFLITETRLLEYEVEAIDLIDSSNTLYSEAAPSSAASSGHQTPTRKASHLLSPGVLSPSKSSRRNSVSLGRSSGRSSRRASVSAMFGLDEKAVKVALFLFNDLIMCCRKKKKSDQYEVEMKCSLANLRVEDVSDTIFSLRLLIDEVPGVNTIYRFECVDRFEKSQWMGAFSKVQPSVFAIGTTDVKFGKQEASFDLASLHSEASDLSEELEKMKRIYSMLSGNKSKNKSRGKQYLLPILYSVPPRLYRATELLLRLKNLEMKAKLLDMTVAGSAAAEEDASSEYSADGIVYNSDDEYVSSEEEKDDQFTMPALKEKIEKLKVDSNRMCQKYSALKRELVSETQ